MEEIWVIYIKQDNTSILFSNSNSYQQVKVLESNDKVLL